jgi:hypothetical protein
MFCIVSWHHEGGSLGFWNGSSWGVSEDASFFLTRKEATLALRKVKGPLGVGCLKPNVLDVEAFNEKTGKAIGPKPTVRMSVKLDKKTGILERIETKVSQK